MAGLDIVDMLEEYHRHPDKSEIEGLTVPAGMTLEAYGEDLHCRARARGVTLLDGMGFAPGVSNIAVGHALLSLDRAVSAREAGRRAGDADSAPWRRYRG